MRHSLLLQPVSAGVVAAFVGFASSFAVVLKGLSAVGASDAEAASGLMALAIAMGVAGIVLSLATRMPIAAAWSTPGAALLAATGATAGGFPEAVGAFLVVGLLFIAAGLIRPFGRLVAAIPPTLANAMLAGVLFGLCLAPIRALAEAPARGARVILHLNEASHDYLDPFRLERIVREHSGAVAVPIDLVDKPGAAPRSGTGASSSRPARSSRFWRSSASTRRGRSGRCWPRSSCCRSR